MSNPSVISLGEVLYSIPGFRFTRDGVAWENLGVIDSEWPESGYRVWTVRRQELRLICRTDSGVWHLQAAEFERGHDSVETACHRIIRPEWANQSLGYQFPPYSRRRICKSCPWKATWVAIE